MEIRPVDARDRPEWLRLRRMLWPQTSQEMHEAEMQKMLVRPDRWGIFICSAPDGRVLGFSEVSLREDPEAIERNLIGYLEGWHVDPGHRRRGIGRGLVEAAESWARERGCRVLASDAAIDNERSHAAHAALGFVETSRDVQFRKTIA